MYYIKIIIWLIATIPNKPSSFVINVKKDHCKLVKSISPLFSHITTITKIANDNTKHKVINKYLPELEKNISFFIFI